jgi:hypothetical protein
MDMYLQKDPIVPGSAGLAVTSGKMNVCPERSTAVQSVLKAGVKSSRMVFPEHGPSRCVEVWEVPSVSGSLRLEVSRYLQELETWLRPADRGELLARILALLSHYRLDPQPPAVEARIADDWAEDLGAFPMWAVDEAARGWRRTKKFKPQISEMVDLCEVAVGDAWNERFRLRLVMERGDKGQSASSYASATADLAKGMFRSRR